MPMDVSVNHVSLAPLFMLKYTFMSPAHDFSIGKPLLQTVNYNRGHIQRDKEPSKDICAFSLISGFSAHIWIKHQESILATQELIVRSFLSLASRYQWQQLILSSLSQLTYVTGKLRSNHSGLSWMENGVVTIPVLVSYDCPKFYFYRKQP
jgi:hypothetical protein